MWHLKRLDFRFDWWKNCKQIINAASKKWHIFNVAIDGDISGDVRNISKKIIKLPLTITHNKGFKFLTLLEHRWVKVNIVYIWTVQADFDQIFDWRLADINRHNNVKRA